MLRVVILYKYITWTRETIESNLPLVVKAASCSVNKNGSLFIIKNRTVKATIKFKLYSAFFFFTVVK